MENSKKNEMTNKNLSDLKVSNQIHPRDVFSTEQVDFRQVSLFFFYEIYLLI
jgi:hypothetical protein